VAAATDTARPAALGVLLQVPQMPFFPQKEALVDLYRLRLRTLPVKTAAQHARENLAIRTLFQQITAGTPGGTLLDPTPFLCGAESCTHREGWRVLYRDDDHLSVYGEQKLAPLFRSWFDTIGGT